MRTTLVKMTLELPKNLLGFWEWYSMIHRQTVAEMLVAQIGMNTFSLLDCLDANDVAYLFNLSKEYQRWKKDP